MAKLIPAVTLRLVLSLACSALCTGSPGLATGRIPTEPPPQVALQAEDTSGHDLHVLPPPPVVNLIEHPGDVVVVNEHGGIAGMRSK